MLFNMLWTSTLETLYMVFFSTAFALLLGFPFGILLVITKENGLWEHLKFHQVLETSINILRSFPFIILMIVLFPLSRVITGTTIGSTAAIVPLAIGTAPFVARMIEGALLEVDSGLIEASESMGASNWTIIRKVMIPEATSSLINGITITIISLIGYSSMAGAIGAGGLGDLAIRYGYQRFQIDLMCYAIVILLIIVQATQWIGNWFINQRKKKLG
ncbi:D-methionine transport system permease protein MetI [Fusobacterium gonidiaformans 3-1-5R]|uniref:D-methionine transport system permease protein MetI n=1 Tax=Fusobacterium gonidiaformans 3-1-5R TaxID=469605 RepID=E5BHD8_9FUSO|nr:methionine ABC transporter permease [Fusobacterium gonidiaformans]EFS21911.1 D-methionine transport system permease protein MetI [Fusobacterium gonidiaformans 3-1-5R]